MCAALNYVSSRRIPVVLGSQLDMCLACREARGAADSLSCQVWGLPACCLSPPSSAPSRLFQSLHSVRQPQVHTVPLGASEEAERRNVLYSVVCKWINAFTTDCNKRLGITLYIAGVSGSMTGLTVVNIVMHVREQMVCRQKTWVWKLQLFLKIIYLLIWEDRKCEKIFEKTEGAVCCSNIFSISLEHSI